MALVHCLARDAAAARPGIDPPPELVEEGVFRAARFGVRGELPDLHGDLRPISDLLQDALHRAEPWASELGCGPELAALPELLRRGGGAGDQRATCEIAGIDAAARGLTEQTAVPH